MKARAKANIFLKLTGFDKRSYHLIRSRFILLDEPYDELILQGEKHKEGFELISDFMCETNIIERAYDLLCNQGYKNELEELFKHKSLRLIKNIPASAGLGGGSSDAACFLMLMNEELHLKLSREKLTELSLFLGSDVAFFLSGFESANVSGCGEFIEEFQDEIPNLEWKFPKIACETSAVYKQFDRGTFDFKENEGLAKIFEKLKTKELLNYKNTELNDLFTPCVALYPKMQTFLEENFFLSGSGSSVFKACE